MQVADGVEATVAEALLAEIESFAAHVHPAFGLHIIRNTSQKGRRRSARLVEVSRPLFSETETDWRADWSQ